MGSDLLTIAHAGVSLAAAFAALWTMQCVTIHAGVATAHSRGMLLLRASLAFLSFGLVVFGVSPIAREAEPWPEMFVLSCYVLLVLLATPIAIGGRPGVDRMADQ